MVTSLRLRTMPRAGYRPPLSGDLRGQRATLQPTVSGARGATIGADNCAGLTDPYHATQGETKMTDTGDFGNSVGRSSMGNLGAQSEMVLGGRK